MSGMTDAIAWFEASETMLRVTHGDEVADEAMAIAARLRGDGEQGQAVACPDCGLPVPGGGFYGHCIQCGAKVYALSTQPAPSADARDLIESFVQHANANANDRYPRKLVEAANSWLAGFRDPAPSEQVAACLTCGGRGWIGGPSFYQPDEGGVQCPDCDALEQVAARVAVPDDAMVTVPRAMLEQVYGMAGQGCESGSAAYRWCERIDEVIHAGQALPEYEDYAEPLPAAAPVAPEVK